MTQNERAVRLSKMQDLLTSFQKIRRTMINNLLSKTPESKESREQYRTLLEEYNKLLIFEILSHLPESISNMISQIPNIELKTILYGHGLQPKKAYISAFVEIIIDENINNEQVIQAVLRRIYDSRLIIEIPGENIIQTKEGESK